MERNILSMVRKEAAKIKNAMTAEKLFSRSEIKRQFSSMIDTLTQQYGERKIIIQMVHDESSSMTGGTDGNNIFINTGNSLVMFFAGLFEKYMAAMGLVFHEVSHILFTDFDKETEMSEEIKNGRLYGETPIPQNQDEQEMLDEMMEALNEPNYRPIFFNIYHYISNIIADAHDEEKMIDEKGGIVKKAILTIREALQSTSLSLEEMKKKDMTELSMVFAMCLQFCRWDQILLENEEEGRKDEMVRKVFNLAGSINNAKYTDNPEVKNNEINRIMFFLWPYIKAELENQENGDGSTDPNANSGDQSTGQGTPSIQAILDQLGQGAQSAGGTNAVQNGTSSQTAKANSQASSGSPSSNTANTQGTGTDEEASKASFESILNAIAEEEAEENIQEAVTQSTNMEINAISQNSTHKGKTVNVIPQNKVGPEDIKRYEMMMRDLKPYARKLIKEMRQVLRDAQAGDIQHGKLYGNRFEANKSFREDGRCWANRKLPQDLPDMAISVLVDHSGSMWGERIDSSMKASMLLYEFATSLEIPVMVCGHDTTSNGIRFYTYTDFKKVNEAEKYRLAKMDAHSCNRDGMAIEVAANLLSKRSEEIKMLIIISDGQPNDDEYGGKLAYDDIRSIVRRYKKQGVEVVAAAIGSDKERIKEIYGDSFLDITDLDKFPKILARIVKKKIV